MCDSANLADGHHTVNVSIVTPGPVFYFDYAVYDPSPTLSLANEALLVDNNDPSLKFNGNWDNRYANLWPLTRDNGDQMVFDFYGECQSLRERTVLIHSR